VYYLVCCLPATLALPHSFFECTPCNSEFPLSLKLHSCPRFRDCVWSHWLVCVQEPSLGTDTGNSMGWASVHCICSSERVECEQHHTSQLTLTKLTNNVSPCIGGEWAQVSVGKWGRRMLSPTFGWWVMHIWWVMIDCMGEVETIGEEVCWIAGLAARYQT